MPNDLLSDLQSIRRITFDAYQGANHLLARFGDPDVLPSHVADTLEKVAAHYERGVVALRNLCEKNHPSVRPKGTKPTLPQIHVSGRVEVNEYGWLHIELNTLLPNCRFQTPAYLTDTISRLLDEREERGQRLPRFDDAMLVVDEYCDIDSRCVFDQDNKGWKAIPNALKGRVIRDDDQFTLNIALISTRSEIPACHIHLLPQEETGDFFSMRHGSNLVFL